ncbi:hypothetical protein I4U23_019724 [Adineta vaga]|nr:hypothetical protein I4U23_019724 [Adineta vaga]
MGNHHSKTMDRSNLVISGGSRSATPVRTTQATTRTIISNTAVINAASCLRTGTIGTVLRC